MSWYSRRETAAGWGLASLIWLIAIVIAVILLLHVVFVLVEANPSNDVVSFINDAPRTLAWVFRDLFNVDNDKLQVLLNYGAAALVYLGLARLVGAFVP
ncbi:MAG TPA: hypothetical protein VKG85_09245 [Actinomycetes bacterium]|nr:hypothetical protein [Actinomycetes bacterium]